MDLQAKALEERELALRSGMTQMQQASKSLSRREHEMTELQRHYDEKHRALDTMQTQLENRRTAVLGSQRQTMQQDFPTERVRTAEPYTRGEGALEYDMPTNMSQLCLFIAAVAVVNRWLRVDGNIYACEHVYRSFSSY